MYSSIAMQNWYKDNEILKQKRNELKEEYRKLKEEFEKTNYELILHNYKYYNTEKAKTDSITKLYVIENDLKLVKYCCAVYQYNKKEIILYYERDEELTEKDFRKAISTVFPAYMIPSEFIKMDELPRNTNGKIDRLKLKTLANEES